MTPKPLRFDPIIQARRHWEERWGDGPAPAMTAVTSIMRAQQLLLAENNGLLAPFNLTFARYEALMLLLFSSRGELPLSTIGQRLQVHPTSVTNLVDRLEKAGLVERAPHTSDRRATLAILTPAGREVAEAATVVLNEHRFSLGALRDCELDAISDAVRKVRIAAGDFVPEPGPPPNGL